jgi:hypothetical protein
MAEVVALLCEILSAVEDIDPRMRYVTCQIDRATLAQRQALIETEGRSKESDRATNAAGSGA